MFIYQAVANAISDKMPGAIKKALGWETSYYDKYKVVEIEVRDGFEAVFKKLPQATIVTDTPTEPEPYEIKPKYKKIKKIIKTTYRTETRFNPATGDTDVREDDNPVTQILEWSEEKERFLIKEHLLPTQSQLSGSGDTPTPKGLDKK